MAQLAIKGHKTRGKEVIEILEMLGGKNINDFSGEYSNMIYTIKSFDYGEIIYMHYRTDGYKVFTLEEFLEKFPYKVGDKVKAWVNGYYGVFDIQDIAWDSIAKEVKYKIRGYWHRAENLQPYKEAPMYLNGKANKQSEEIKKTIESVKEIMEEIKIDIPDGYEFFGIDDDSKIVLTKKQSQYPKNYKECCDVLGLITMENDAQGYKGYLMIRFQELLIARDAYWKIIGEEMRLGQPWEPNWNNDSQFKYIITCRRDKIIKDTNTAKNSILAFPTEEMRDAFYENFKDLIEECKQFL